MCLGLVINYSQSIYKVLEVHGMAGYYSNKIEGKERKYGLNISRCTHTHVSPQVPVMSVCEQVTQVHEWVLSRSKHA